jgi:hypothetical protein
VRVSQIVVVCCGPLCPVSMTMDFERPPPLDEAARHIARIEGGKVDPCPECGSGWRCKSITGAEKRS